MKYFKIFLKQIYGILMIYSGFMILNWSFISFPLVVDIISRLEMNDIIYKILIYPIPIWTLAFIISCGVFLGYKGFLILKSTDIEVKKR